MRAALRTILFGGVPRPALDLDFLGGVLDSRITFTRASAATYVNSAGLIASASTNVPRFDYDPVTLAIRGLLIEESRANTILRSEEFDNASWTVSQSARTANAATAPDGATTADLVTPNAASAEHYVTQTFTASASSWTLSVYYKPNGYTKIGIRESSATGAYATFDCSGSGSVLATSSATGSVELLSNGWYRVRVVYTSGGGTNGMRVHVFDAAYTNQNPSGYTYSGDTTSGGYFWGAQAEAGAFATSYIPTAGATVTRSADSARIQGASFSSWYNQEKGTIAVTARNGDSTGNRDPFSMSDLSVNAIVSIRFNGTAMTALMFEAGGTTTVNIGGVSGSISEFRKSAYAYAANDAAVSNNGGAVASDSSCAPPLCTEALIGGDFNDGVKFDGHIARIRYWPRRLPNAMLQALTA